MGETGAGSHSDEGKLFPRRANPWPRAGATRKGFLPRHAHRDRQTPKGRRHWPQERVQGVRLASSCVAQRGIPSVLTATQLTNKSALTAMHRVRVIPLACMLTVLRGHSWGNSRACWPRIIVSANRHAPHQGHTPGVHVNGSSRGIGSDILACSPR